MAGLDADSVDAIVTDPPYGLSFMGKDWDHGIPGEQFWKCALRVAKPGAHLLAFGGTRTFHRLAVAIEDGGWEIRDCVMWVYGSGFPKSLDVSKAIDKALGAERTEVLYERPGVTKTFNVGAQETVGPRAPATAPATAWQGWGTALKPAWEPIIVARKPLAGTVAANVLKHGTGALNIDSCRIEYVGTEDAAAAAAAAAAEIRSKQTERNFDGWGMRDQQIKAEEYLAGPAGLGRWPANVIHDGSDEVVALFPDAPGQLRSVGPEYGEKSSVNAFGDYGPREAFNPRNDAGSAARFFYTAKASRFDRNDGLDGMPAHDRPAVESAHSTVCAKCNRQRVNVSGACECAEPEWVRVPQRARANHHPTVKPTDLMRYLCRLVTPKGGTVLDPFMGSGSTLKAAEIEGFSAIGIDLNPEYCEIARRRIASDAPLFADVA